MEKLALLSKYLLSLAIIYFSTVLLLLVNEAAETRKAIPLLIDKLDSIENSENILEVLRMAAQITGNTARVSEEVTAIRKDLPALYSEIDKTRAVIPGILEEVKAVRDELPGLYTEVDKTRNLIPEILKEMESTRNLVPNIINEVKAVREDTPKLLANTSDLLDRAQKISDEAGKGAVHGAVKGVLTAPLNVLESGFSTVKDTVTGKEKERNKK